MFRKKFSWKDILIVVLTLEFARFSTNAFHKGKAFLLNQVSLIFNSGLMCCYAAPAYNECIECNGKNRVFAPSAARKHNSLKLRYASTSSKTFYTKDFQPYPRVLQIMWTENACHMIDLTENSDLQVKGQGLDLRETCTKI